MVSIGTVLWLLFMHVDCSAKHMTLTELSDALMEQPHACIILQGVGGAVSEECVCRRGKQLFQIGGDGE